MKRIIDGKRYNTDTADEVAGHSQGYSGDFGEYSESLYKTKKGAWFLAGSGGPMTRYASSCDGNSWTWGEDLSILTPDEAQAWLERHDEIDALDEHFGHEIEEA